jgi:hypothetical protein
MEFAVHSVNGDALIEVRRIIDDDDAQQGSLAGRGAVGL